VNRALVVGYGNPIRSDDGVGWHVARLLQGDRRLAGADVLACHQLTPELVVDMARADVVVLVDASTAPPGSISVEAVDGSAGAGRPGWTHHLDPNGLVELTKRLYGRAPSTSVVSVGAASLDAGDRLSPTVEGCLAAVVDAVVGTVESAASAI
jgi:hydrogenase maturation protease